MHTTQHGSNLSEPARDPLTDRFFFRPEMPGEVASLGWVVLPECTGIWWREGIQEWEVREPTTGRMGSWG